MSKGTYLKRKEMGLCVKCGGEIETERKGKCTCYSCIQKDKEYKRESKNFARSIGVCPRCMKNKLFGDEKNCLECRVKNQEMRRKQREDNPVKEAEYEHNAKINRRKRYQQRKQHHLCVTCGKPLRQDDTAHSNCDSCRRKVRDKHILSTKPKSEYKMFIWLSQGLCPYCGKEKYGRTGACKYHYDILKLNGGKNEKWEKDNLVAFKKIGETA